MTSADTPSLQVIAMHGWSGEASHWQPWQQAFGEQGWSWQSGERGYGGADPCWPLWQATGLKVVIAHSLGPHLLPPPVLAAAEAVVLLASFGRFVPPGPSGRRLRHALAAMEAQLDQPETARAMLRSFLARAAAPEPAELLPPGPADRLLGDFQRLRLREDLQLLGRCSGLPAGFPPGIPVLAVEAGEDQIVVPEARELLRRDLEASGAQLQWLTLAGAGHCLLRPGVLAAVQAWLQPLVAASPSPRETAAERTGDPSTNSLAAPASTPPPLPFASVPVGRVRRGDNRAAGSAASPSTRDGLGPAAPWDGDHFGQQVRHSFGRQADVYEAEARLQQAMAWRLGHLCRQLPLPAGPRADLGAGTGLLSRALLLHQPLLRQQPPLQLDLCPELLARNPFVAAAPPPIEPRGEGASHKRGNGLVWDLNTGLPEQLRGAALLASSFALQWLQDPARLLDLWCRNLGRGGWLVLAVPTAGSFPQWRQAATQAAVPCTALCLPEAEDLVQVVRQAGLQLQHCRRLRFSQPGQGGLPTLQHLRRLGANASRRPPLNPGQLRRLLRHWSADSPLTWELLLLLARRPG